MASSAGESLHEGHRQGRSTKEQVKDLSYSFGRDVIGGRLGWTGGLLGKQTNWLGRDSVLSKLGASALEMAVSSGVTDGMDWFTGRDKKHQTSKTRQKD